MDNYSYQVAFVNSLIQEHAHKSSRGYSLSVSELDDEDVSKLALIFYEKDNRDQDCVHENSSDLPSLVAKLLRCNSEESDIAFAQAVRAGIIEFYTKRMQELIDERLGWMFKDDTDYEPYPRRRHADNGEVHYR